MAPTPQPWEFNHDATVEILLRIRPDEPANLFSAALVCKPWLRIICDPGFRRRYITFHGGPPLLGLLHDLLLKEDAENPPAPSASGSSLMDSLCKFVKRDPRACVAPRPIPRFRESFPIPSGELFPQDCRHGRVLVIFHNLDASPDYAVWDPVMGDLHSLPKPPESDALKYCATVLCAAEGCDHLTCHGTSFLVLLAATSFFPETIHAWVYSSETDVWTHPAPTVITHEHFMLRPHAPYLSPVRPAIVHGAVYFPVRRGNAIVKYDLNNNILSSIDPPPTNNYYFALMPIERTSLGFACIDGCCLYVWVKKVDTEEVDEWDQDWELYMEIDLEDKIPSTPNDLPFVVGFAEGPDMLFVSTSASLYTVNLSSGSGSGQIKKFGEPGYFGGVLPYTSFYMPGVPQGKQSINLIAVQEQVPNPVVEAPTSTLESSLDLLPPSKMVLDHWKSLYSNTKRNFNEVAVKGFWEMYDPQGYCLYFCEYKYQEENTESHVTLNKVMGFLQQMDPCRKYAFGKMLVIGSEAPFKLKGLWLFRGQEIPKFVMDKVKDMHLYEWTKVDISDEAQKERVKAMIEDLEPFEGQALLDAKCFK